MKVDSAPVEPSAGIRVLPSLGAAPPEEESIVDARANQTPSAMVEAKVVYWLNRMTPAINSRGLALRNAGRLTREEDQQQES